MNGVVTAKREFRSEGSGRSSQRFVDTNRDELFVGMFEAPYGFGVKRLGEAATSVCCRERRHTLREGENGRGTSIWRSPKLVGNIRSPLRDHELDQGGGVEVESQRR